ncbi:ABC transporter substrate-binding protein [Rothia aerolata]|uniref:Glycine/betaine ABC transporter substrate-binding protein n=1 Tax=Rothia aerolata TaxID=1812262 RepID=A0A917IU51_9MICC|nr:ABC transporter substrate-binding protein [Rothia aerolata]GGH64549.1 glycine/betaine ABC transporter substrate-binding protein [Rothia aerolata]
MTSLNRRRFFGLAGVSASALALSACGISGETAFGSGSTDGTVVIGSADFTESQIIVEIYAAALKKRGFTAETRPAIGAREAFIGALEEGAVGVVPDYTGNLLLFLDTSATAVTAEEILSSLKDALPEELSVLEPAPAENKDSMVVTSETASSLGLRSMADLSAHPELKLGAPPEFAERSYGLPGLKSKYGFEPAEFSPINDGGGPLTVQALLDDDVQVVDLFSTDPAISRNNLVILEDPGNNFIAQQVVPVVNGKLVSVAAADVLNEVSALLTTEDLVALNDRVSGEEKANVATAAGDWVEEKFPS